MGLPRVLKRLCACAGIEGVSLHTLRHSFAAAAAELGFSELTIAGLIGHKMQGVTARYAHVPDTLLLLVAGRPSFSPDRCRSRRPRHRGSRVVTGTIGYRFRHNRAATAIGKWVPFFGVTGG